MFFLVTDAHFKWPEVSIMSSSTAVRTIAVLREMFARFGIPEQLVSDNGPQFQSDEFKQFMTANGIKHIRSSPYHPASNGAAERMVQTLKLALKADHKQGVSLEKSLANFLLHYRRTPHITRRVSPCTVMMNRDLRTRLDLLKPDIASRVHNKQADQKYYCDDRRHSRVFTADQDVMVRNFREGDKWVPGKIVDQLGPVSYLVQCTDGCMWRRHVDHILDKTVSSERSEESLTLLESSVSSEDDTDSVNVTEFAKTNLMGTNTEIHFLPVDKSHTHVLSKDTKHLRLDGQVCFFRRLFPDAVKPRGWPVWPLRGINKTAWGAKLILMAGLAYPASCACLGHLLMAQHGH